MSEQARHELALKLANQLRGLEPERQIAAVNEWRATQDALTRALKRARRLYAERSRVAALEGRGRRLELPGVSGAIFDRLYDYVIEGAVEGAGRELAQEDAPRLASAYQQVEAAALELGRAHRGDRIRLRLGLAAMPLHAVALGYWYQRGSFGALTGTSIDLVTAVGKEKPAVKIAALALAELGHSNGAIAGGLDIDRALARRLARSARVS